VSGAFATTRVLRGAPRLALVDDVVTTGSTVLAAAAALHVAGAGSVELWVVARARRLSSARDQPEDQNAGYGT
jgi:predicted amidophosphoribosyltransferase